MKNILVFIFFLLSFELMGQNLPTYQYGQHTLTGKVILKNLRHPTTGKTIKNVMVFVLPKLVKFLVGPNDKDGNEL